MTSTTETLHDEYPDAQVDGPELRMPAATYDPTPEEQQAFADTYRAEHLHADRLDAHGGTALTRALYAWRDEIASERWRHEAAWATNRYPCRVCGDTSASHATVTIGPDTMYVCRRCRASVLAAHAAIVADEVLADGRTRADAARALVAACLDRAAT
jgi:hypothetical protein